MKKIFITMLMMVVALVGMFAAETHTLKIKADVVEVIPAFQLELLAPAATVTTNTTPTAFSASATYNPLTTSTAKDVNFNLDEDGTVTVQCNLANLAKTNKAYTLTFGGGTFAAKKNGSAFSHVPSSVISAKGTDVANTYTITREGTVGVGNEMVTVTFHGKTVTDIPAVLATCVYSYTGDPEIDPTTEVEPYYFADITLTIAAV